MNKRIVYASLLLILSLSITTFAYAGLKNLVVIPTTGEIAEPEVTTSPSAIDWGIMAVNSSRIRAVTLNNTGPVPITALHMSYTLPANMTGTLTWDAEDKPLAIAETLTATFNLTVTDAPLGPFSFDIIIDGE